MTEKTQRKSYTREFKLSVVSFYCQNNLYQTSKKFYLNTKTILRWAAPEEAISKGSKGSKHCIKHQRPDHPEVEATLMAEMRRKGLKVS